MSSTPSAAIEAAAARVLAFGRQQLAARPECSNIASPVGLAQYLAIAAEVAAWARSGRVLDWGAGWGQTSLLLRPRLPFADGEFDAVLNCGVLEHVEDEGAALAELRRVLRPGGRLFTYHLPNRYAYTEWLGRQLGRFHHDRTYTRREAAAVFERAGFRVEGCRPFHVLPRNVWGRLPARLSLVPWTGVAYDRVDALLERLPGVRGLATAWAVVADRAP
jgi:SAM-dependent methyltransferase